MCHSQIDLVFVTVLWHSLFQSLKSDTDRDTRETGRERGRERGERERFGERKTESEGKRREEFKFVYIFLMLDFFLNDCEELYGKHSLVNKVMCTQVVANV